MLKRFVAPLLSFSLLAAGEVIEAERAPLDTTGVYVERLEPLAPEIVAELGEDLVPNEMEMGFFYMFSPRLADLPSCYYNYPNFAQEIAFFKNDGSGFEIADGSRYLIAYADRSITRSWKQRDVIVFFPCDEWFSFYQLRARNLTNGTEVKVNIHQGPLISSPYLKMIESIDYDRMLVRLTDGSLWGIWEGDYNRLNKWQPGNVILTGCSYSTSGEAILFNVTVDDSFRKYSYATFLGQ